MTALDLERLQLTTLFVVLIASHISVSSFDPFEFAPNLPHMRSAAVIMRRRGLKYWTLFVMLRLVHNRTIERSGEESERSEKRRFGAKRKSARQRKIEEADGSRSVAAAVYRMVHFRCRRLGACFCIPALMASSNMDLSPSWVRAEHSM